jgi:rubredoxin
MSYTVRVLAKGGILTPLYLQKILGIVKICDKKHIHFGSRQDLLFTVSNRTMLHAEELFKTSKLNYIIHGRKGSHYQNIVSSYVSSDMTAATSWLTSGSYLNILEQFSYDPMLKINITDPKQSLVPLFYGNLNFVASPVKDYWFLYLRKNENSLPERWPALILNTEIASLSKKIEDAWSSFKGIINKFFTNIQYDKNNWKKVDAELKNEFLLPHDYEGFGKMYTSNNYWAGFYWRDNNYDLPFLEEVGNLCLRTNISKICITPWKSFLVKEIQEKDLIHWHRLLGRFGINMRHSSFELNWHIPLKNKQAFRLKRTIVRNFDKTDVCVHGLTFGIKSKPEMAFTSIVIERNPGIKILKSLDPFASYSIYHARNFDANSCIYEEFVSNISHNRLPAMLQNLTLKFYAQISDTSVKPVSKPKPEIDNKPEVYQCPRCFSIYDEKVGDPLAGIAANTLFAILPETFCCSLCEAPKADFKKISLKTIIKEANA